MTNSRTFKLPIAAAVVVGVLIIVSALSMFPKMSAPVKMAKAVPDSTRAPAPVPVPMIAAVDEVVRGLDWGEYRVQCALNNEVSTRATD